MRSISRRRLLAAGIGLPAGPAAAAAAAYGLMEEGVRPGKSRLAELLGACGAPPGPPRGPLPARRQVTFWSAYRQRDGRMGTLIPTQQAVSLGVVIALHGLGGSARASVDLYGPAMAAAGVSTFTVITMDGGSTYWHQRSTGDDPLGMIIHEVLPRAAARGLATARIGIVGYSMGGYGALLLAESLGPAAAAV